MIGMGKVGSALAHNFWKKEHTIIIAHDDLKSESVLRAQRKNPDFTVMPVQEAINNADVIFLATPFHVNEKLLKPLRFQGKTLVDCTNPVGNGITHGLQSKISGAEKVQEWAPNACVVKSYTIYGYENLENTSFPEYNVKPVMLIAGNNMKSKQALSSLNSDLGFKTLDVGALSQSVHLEHMTLLWVKMVRVNGHHPNFTWACLER